MIPYERIAWLRIRGVPLQLWIDAVFECIGERFGRIVKKSDVDEKDVCFNEEVISVLVNNGSTIEEKVPVRWKNMVFDVWVSEVNQFWTPEFVNERFQIDDQDVGINDDVSKSDNMVTEENGVPAPVPEERQPEKETVGNEQMENGETVVDAQSKGFDCNSPIIEEPDTEINDVQIPSLEVITEDGPTTKGQNINDEQVLVQKSGWPEGIASPNIDGGPDNPILPNVIGHFTSDTGGPDGTTQKKRKRCHLLKPERMH
ncbi:hypothetical protein HanIR_Chr01g0004941 [Helianthus annuus]|nr:hypothetical protein HanIR_Chr01g0004941 [Helianthus annuus]